MSKYLLITSCSRRKKDDKGLLTAWKRYEGGAFPLLKRLQRGGHLPANLDILIISARYGLLLPDDMIENYDKVMTSAQAEKHRASIEQRLSLLLSQSNYKQSFVLLEPTYILALGQVQLPEPIYAYDFSPNSLKRLQSWILHLDSD